MRQALPPVFRHSRRTPPRRIRGVQRCPPSQTCQQLSLAIGNKGQNARLCARLPGYNIDIRPESGYYGEEEPKAAEAEKTEDTAAE